MMHDVIVIGGGYAGMAAALQLLRARRRVAVIDAGARRNRFAAHAHGFLAQDGTPPEQIAAQARAQLERYPDLTWIEAEAVSLDGTQDRFEVTLSDGTARRGRRVLMATGVSDLLPAIEGIGPRWGRSVFHCPYCHGYELDRGAIGVIASSALSLHQAELLTEWGSVTFLLNGAPGLDDAARDGLARRGVRIEEGAIRRLENDADIRLADGRLLCFAGLFVATTVRPASPLPVEAGCAMEETPMGTRIRTGATRETSVPGIFACGDLAVMPHSVSLAVGDGALAGAQLHRSLVWPGT
ncbi:NAD(P)/FAD-dependent oxidoreductase [Mangrovicoccus algicola]|uniref:Thioredoxin reductase n=1 Tax=Mangrovicoccus algicola TaxID=2771008 RepID=A0A8J6Z0D9_9RHOB|nr:NAD(P)/FAD-dependent oxidoreductase [Mangrovicoccus algicola]MBE3639248.1 NAD(P)/FAD-dependent oxidoreductase [Mangrovicoccus algicola]